MKKIKRKQDSFFQCKAKHIKQKQPWGIGRFFGLGDGLYGTTLDFQG